MKIKILGIGCSNCRKLEQNVAEAVSNKGLEAEIIKVDDFAEIASYGVMSMPGLIIDGEIKASGRIPSAEEIGNWIK